MAEKAVEQSKLDRLTRFLLDDDEPSKTIVIQLKQCERRIETLNNAVATHETDVNRQKGQREIMSGPDELREASKHSSDFLGRSRLREEIRHRVARIDLYFRFEPLILVDVSFTNGSKRQLLFWPKQSGIAVVLPKAAEKLLTVPMEKGSICMY